MIIYRSILGSTVYGTKIKSSDLDIFDIYLGEYSEYRSEVEMKKGEDYYSFHFIDFMKRLSRNDFRSIEGLFSPIVEKIDDKFQFIRDNRQKFLTKKVYDTFCLWSLIWIDNWDIELRLSKFEGEEKEKQIKYLSDLGLDDKEYNGLQMKHYIRLLGMGIEILKTGDLILERPNKDFLIKIRGHKVKMSKIRDEVDKMKIELEEAYQNTNLPNEVDRDLLKECINLYKIK